MLRDVLSQRGSKEGYPLPDLTYCRKGLQSHLEEKGVGKLFLPSSPGKTLFHLSLLGGGRTFPISVPMCRVESPCVMWGKAWWLCWSMVSSPLAVMDGLVSYCLCRAYLWEPLSSRLTCMDKLVLGFAEPEHIIVKRKVF